MAEYINIKGTNRQVLSSDPSNPTLGQIWYNTTSNTLKGRVLQSSAWATANSMTTARRSYGYAGTQTAALAAGGSFPAIATTEEYGGTSWTTVNSMPASKLDVGAAGVQTAALVFGGYNVLNTTEEYDGTNWTGGGNLGTGARNMAGFGVQTAAVSTGGQSTGNPYTSATEEYDGSSWTAGGSLSEQRSRLMGFGTLTAGVATGGTNTPGIKNNTEEYNGSSWTSGGNLNTARKESGSSSGVQTSAIVFGGLSPATGNVALTELYDGTSFANDAAMGTARSYLRGMGSTTASLGAGGYPPQAGLVTTEEYSGTSEATVTIDPV